MNDDRKALDLLGRELEMVGHLGFRRHTAELRVQDARFLIGALVEHAGHFDVGPG